MWIMLKIRKSEERGHVQFTWLDTRHSFSFGSYYDPSFMGFRNSRVINEVKIAPGRGSQVTVIKTCKLSLT